MKLMLRDFVKSLKLYEDINSFNIHNFIQISKLEYFICLNKI